MSAVIVTAITFGALALMDIGCWVGVVRAPRASVRRNQVALVSTAMLVAVGVWGWAFVAAITAR
ncbi:MAG TPA: hypothetical protein VMV29_10175 [Ktedonobacterales bacterium]|nr:hypothetical protein [Ktedonobacterales bacterium]